MAPSCGSSSEESGGGVAGLLNLSDEDSKEGLSNEKDARGEVEASIIAETRGEVAASTEVDARGEVAASIPIGAISVLRNSNLVVGSMAV